MTAAEFRPIPHPAFLMLDPGEIPPPEALPVITDRFPPDAGLLSRLCQGRDAVLLDFECPPSADTRAVVQSLPCPAAAPPGYSDTGPVFLPPASLHVPLEEYLSPWKGREIWLEAALQQQVITVTPHGVTIAPPAPNTERTGGFYAPDLHCRFTQEFTEDRAVFTLFDTPQTLREKLEHAAALGVTRAVGLYVELGEKHMSTY